VCIKSAKTGYTGIQGSREICDKAKPDFPRPFGGLSPTKGEIGLVGNGGNTTKPTGWYVQCPNDKDRKRGLQSGPGIGNKPTNGYGVISTGGGGCYQGKTSLNFAEQGIGERNHIFSRSKWSKPPDKLRNRGSRIMIGGGVNTC